MRGAPSIVPVVSYGIYLPRFHACVSWLSLSILHGARGVNSCYHAATRTPRTRSIQELLAIVP
jgi:hypothetical protein